MGVLKNEEKHDRMAKVGDKNKLQSKEPVEVCVCQLKSFQVIRRALIRFYDLVSTKV